MTLEKIYKDFSIVRAWIGDNQCFHKADDSFDYGEFCDIYFNAIDKIILQKQVDVYNKFHENLKSYINEIEEYIKNLNENNIKDTLTLDVIEIPQNNLKYDLVLVCSAKTKQFIFFKRNISLRIEFINGKINSIESKNDTTEDNK